MGAKGPKGEDENMSDIPQTSRAACVVAFKEPLEIRQVPMPHDIEPGAMLVQTEVASICGSDVHLSQEALGVASRLHLPIILGHEMMERVVRLGPGGSTGTVGQPLAEGDRICLEPRLVWACSMCTVTHKPTLCLHRRITCSPENTRRQRSRWVGT